MAVQRFILDSTTLDNAGFGLDGGAAFILDSSALDSSRVLDGGEFLTVATGASSLGGLGASASAQATLFPVFSSSLGGLNASASAQSQIFPILSAKLGGLDASAQATATIFPVLSSQLGGLDAVATASSEIFPIFDAPLDGLDATATAQSTPPAPPPVDDGVGYLPPYPQRPMRRKPKPVEIPVEINEPKKPRLVSAVGSSRFGGAVIAATGLIAFSILDDDAEVLLLV
jgi:hypothetical protein